ncbi:MAG: DUF4388 domain-containing protein [Deltaproteobacteria bacterium]|nr:DUF4388 domain-containing protein [Deltaproteobacteria bacterium]
MALRGTLKDFGIADIFQLIGHQTKTGILLLKNRDSEVKVSFKEGTVVKVESQTRQKKELLGHMLVRAEVLTDQQLEEALTNQRRSLRRLGDVLTQNGWITKELLGSFARLQATETIYRLFSWESGTYEFEQKDVAPDPDFGEALRAESVLMEGFRMVDEWPMIRKKITGYGMCFATMKPLPDEAAEDDGGFDDAFGEMGDDKPKKKKKGDPDIGASERKVFALVTPERDVQKLIDLGRIGEFETCKALSVLLQKGYIATKTVEAKRPTTPPIEHGGLVTDKSFAPTLAWSFVGLVAVVLVVGLGIFVGRADVSLLPRSFAVTTPPAVKAALLSAQRERITLALETLRLEEGRYPDDLQALVRAGLLQASDLQFPAEAPFSYHVQGPSYELVPPLP